MTFKNPIYKWTGLVLFFLGSGIGLFLAGVMTWSEMEANLASSLPDSKRLKFSCPLMLSPAESGTIRAEIVNETDKEVKPVVTAGFGQPDSLDQEFATQTYILAPGETQTVQWTVDDSHTAFENIVPVVIVQSRYSHNPPRRGACGILIFSLFGLPGSRSLVFIVSSAVLLMAAGLAFALPGFAAQGDETKSLRQAVVFLAVLTIIALTSALFRLWGLTILIETVSAITVITILTDIVILPHKPTQ
jgi:hypothetical protein